MRKAISKTFRYLLLLALLFGLVIVVTEILFPISLKPASQTSRVVLATDGTWLYAQTNHEQKWRFGVDVSKLDPLYLEMLITFEDKRFWNHFGFDPLAMSRAIFQLIVNGRITSGGSTITMQLARLLEPKERTVLSKVIEIIRAFQLELHYSKSEILQAYLTLAPYGGNTEGVVAASMRYFDKLPYSLSASEAALLVCLPKSPELNRPDRHPNKSKKARDRVLSIAKKRDIISAAYYSSSLEKPLPTRLAPFPRYAPHLSLKLLAKHNKSYINTTLEAPLQKKLEQWAIKKGSSLPKGATLSLLLVENNSSQIKAYIGSHSMFDPKISGYIDMIPVPRSPGSALKPFIYALGFEQHIIHPYTQIYDTQTRFGNYLPHNFSKKFTGEVTIAYALQHSLNIPVVKVLQRVGAEEFIQRLEILTDSLKIPKEKATLPVALGGLGISIWQMAQLYVALAHGGWAYPLHYLPSTKPAQSKRLLTQEAAKSTTAILRDVTPPKGYTNSTQLIAYKTGTSYGYRDLWTAAYTPQYTVIVWIGRPNNAPQLKYTGRQMAAPMAFEAISILDSIHRLKPWSWNTSYLSKKPPVALSHFDKEIKQHYASLEFVYPKEGTRYFSAGCHDTLVKVSVHNGKPPYYWYIDDNPTDITDAKHDIPFKEGSHSITIIDSSGERITRHIWVFSPDC